MAFARGERITAVGLNAQNKSQRFYKRITTGTYVSERYYVRKRSGLLATGTTSTKHFTSSGWVLFYRSYGADIYSDPQYLILHLADVGAHWGGSSDSSSVNIPTVGTDSYYSFELSITFSYYSECYLYWAQDDCSIGEKLRYWNDPTSANAAGFDSTKPLITAAMLNSGRMGVEYG